MTGGGLARGGSLFEQGIARAGYELVPRAYKKPSPEDVLILWNRHKHMEAIARDYERVGARVVVAENGYFSRDPAGRKYYALSIGHHVGAGKWIEGGPERWDSFGFKVKPWREDGRHILVLPQRGIGEKGIAMPRNWLASALDRLRHSTKRPIRIRHHPGPEKSEPYEDLRDAWAAVVWASSSGLKSMLVGVPVFYDFPDWVGAPAAKQGLDEIEKPALGDRLPMFRRLAWAQWRAEEIASGEAFKWLLKS